MSVRCTDLPANDVVDLQSFIDQRMRKGAVYVGSGQIAHINNNSCYYCLLRKDRAAADQPLYRQEYIVCFVSELSDDFDLFKPELDAFCLNDVMSLLFGGSNSASNSAGNSASNSASNIASNSASSASASSLLLLAGGDGGSNPTPSQHQHDELVDLLSQWRSTCVRSFSSSSSSLVGLFKRGCT